MRIGPNGENSRGWVMAVQDAEQGCPGGFGNVEEDDGLRVVWHVRTGITVMTIDKDIFITVHSSRQLAFLPRVIAAKYDKLFSSCKSD